LIWGVPKFSRQQNHKVVAVVDVDVAVARVAHVAVGVAFGRCCCCCCCFVIASRRRRQHLQMTSNVIKKFQFVYMAGDTYVCTYVYIPTDLYPSVLYICIFGIVAVVHWRNWIAASLAFPLLS